MVEARVDARTPEEAIDKVMQQPPVQEIMKNKWGRDAEIEVEVEPIEDAVLDKERFVLQPSKEEGWYVLTDTELLITLRFRAGDFNGSQKVTMIDEHRVADPMDIATSLRLMGDWMLKHHKELI
jgi:hypothetical protein